jgi:ankyrin repeat protein
MSLQNAAGYTPLRGAGMTDQADVAKLLLEHKANVDYRDKKVTILYIHIT